MMDFVKFDDEVTVALITKEQAIDGECTRIRWSNVFYGFTVSYKTDVNATTEIDVGHFRVEGDDYQKAFRLAVNWAQDYLFGDTPEQKMDKVN